jgi:hypothetical protein
VYSRAGEGDDFILTGLRRSVTQDGVTYVGKTFGEECGHPPPCRYAVATYDKATGKIEVNGLIHLLVASAAASPDADGCATAASDADAAVGGFCCCFTFGCCCFSFYCLFAAATTATAHVIGAGACAGVYDASLIIFADAAVVGAANKPRNNTAI